MSKEKENTVQYCNVSRKIWNTVRFRRLSQEAKILFLYIITCPHGNMIGCFVLRPGYAVDDLQMDSRERFHERLKELLREGLVMYDAENEMVLDTEHFVKNPLYNPNQIIAAIKKLNDLPRSILFDSLISILEKIDNGLDKPLYEPLRKRLGERLPEGYAKPEAVTVTESVTESYTDLSSGITCPPEPDPPAAPFKEPEPKKTQTGKPDEYLAQLQSLVAQVKAKYPKMPIETWYGKNRRAHPEAILHVLRSILKAEHIDLGKEMAYIQKALDVENGKYNAKDFDKDQVEIKRPVRGEFATVGALLQRAQDVATARHGP